MLSTSDLSEAQRPWALHIQHAGLCTSHLLLGRWEEHPRPDRS